MDLLHIKRALISVYDKTGIIDFAKVLQRFSVQVVSTGGTLEVLSAAGMDVIPVSKVTGFPEILDGRVKTLHPAIHSGLLARLDCDEHTKQLEDMGYKSIDLIVVNLYPFEETLNKKGSSDDEILENIDIGGPTMLRSAAKNYHWTAVVVNPCRYDEIVEILKSRYYKKT